ncbi:MAG TPA: hypothetical protein VLC46_16485 [Thermoanaerobaculia bacterium]|jgi:hypothetical protein|nr:hypothetical protein [Thermoanaerobaculia bacterium]
MKTARLATLLILFATACHQQSSAGRERIASAAALTKIYAGSRVSGLRLEAKAAPMDRSILLIRIGIPVDDSQVEAIHYGTGSFGVTPNGIRRFYLDHRFRGVIYQDATGATWAYGSVRTEEVAVR